MKTFLPPLIAFMAFSVFVITSAYANAMQIGDMGEGNVHAFMACFYYCWPLYFICAILTQWIFIVPVWDVFVLRSALGALVTFVVVAVVCALAAGGVTYALWDKSAGFDNFLGLASIMFLVTGKVVKLKRVKAKEPDIKEEKA